jgi:hypothetical protein
MVGQVGYNQFKGFDQDGDRVVLASVVGNDYVEIVVIDGQGDFTFSWMVLPVVGWRSGIL